MGDVEEGIQSSTSVLEAEGQPRLFSVTEERNVSDTSSRHSSGSSFESMQSFQFHRNKWTMTFFVVIMGLAACTSFLAIGINTAIDESGQIFQREASEFTQSIESAMNKYELFTLWTHQGCFKTFDPAGILPEDDIAGYLGVCSREEFHRLYQHIGSVGLQFNSIQLIPNVTHDIREAYERQAHDYYEENFPDFQYEGIRSLTYSADGTGSLGRRSERPFYFPVMYAEPTEPNLVAVDVDVYNYAYQSLITKVIATWQPALSERIRLLNLPQPDSYGIVFQQPRNPLRRADTCQSIGTDCHSDSRLFEFGYKGFKSPQIDLSVRCNLKRVATSFPRRHSSGRFGPNSFTTDQNVPHSSLLWHALL